MEIPTEQIKPEKVKGKWHAEVNILGIAAKPDGTAAAKFSDTVKLDFQDKDEMKRFKEQPMHYENEFDVAPGKYTLKVVYNFGRNFGKVEAPLAVDPWDGKVFSLSGVAFSKDFHRITGENTDLDAQLIEGRTPLVAQGIQLVPTGVSHIKKNENGAVYVEVYEPLLMTGDPPQIGLELKVTDSKSGAVAQDTGLMNMASFTRPGNPIVPIGLRLPIDKLTPGSYTLALRARDSAGRDSVIRTLNIEVE